MRGALASRLASIKREVALVAQAAVSSSSSTDPPAVPRRPGRRDCLGPQALAQVENCPASVRRRSRSARRVIEEADGALSRRYVSASRKPSREESLSGLAQRGRSLNGTIRLPMTTGALPGHRLGIFPTRRPARQGRFDCGFGWRARRRRGRFARGSGSHGGVVALEASMPIERLLQSCRAHAALQDI